MSVADQNGKKTTNLVQGQDDYVAHWHLPSKELADNTCLIN